MQIKRERERECGVIYISEHKCVREIVVSRDVWMNVKN